ncbi:MAG: C1 family peptidase [Armatimonadetes bacterium]|nr:C1 family peptidase [Armatimonadota bacterium]
MPAQKSQTPPSLPGVLDSASLARYRKEFEREARNRQSMNAITTTPVNKVALNRAAVCALDNSFSVHLPENKATAQNSSGRCWIFAALNTFRVKAIAEMKLGEEFELSQAHVCFWDKLEKANYFLENILVTLEEPVGSRVLDYLLAAPIQDGGQWHMFTNVIRKHGVVPKSVMPETDSSSNTGLMNHFVTERLRTFAKELREGAGGKSDAKTQAKLRTRKDAMMAEIYRMLCMHLGVPPETFHWQWRDKDRNFHRSGTITPQGFYKKFVNIDLEATVCLIHDPRPMHRFDEVYTVQYLGNVTGGSPVLYLNVDLETMKAAAIQQLKDGEPVWFGCDVGKFLDRDSGAMCPGLFDYSQTYGWDGSAGLDKAGRLMYGHSAMNHAMVFTGVDLNDTGKPNRWRIENSWSDKGGDKGFYQMSDRWFDDYNFEVVVQTKYVPKKSLRALQRTPVVLPPWDPMGSLAL